MATRHAGFRALPLFMRKLLATLVIIAFISSPLSAEAAFKPGSSCPTLSKTKTIGKVGYTCSKQGTRKVWLQTIRVGASCKKIGISTVVLNKKYICMAKGKTRTWSLVKMAGANQRDTRPVPSSTESSINIIYDSLSAKNKIPVRIERIDPPGSNAVKSFKRELTESSTLTSLTPGRYELTLGVEKIDAAQGSYIGILSSSTVLLSEGENRSVEVSFSTLMPKSTHAVSTTDYTEFKELSNGAIQFKSAALSSKDIKQNEYLILPPSSELEYGYIGRIISKSADIFLLNPASYFDAIPQGSFHSVVDLGSSDYTFQPTFEAGNIKGNLSSGITTSANLELVSPAVKCSIDSGLEFTAKVTPKIEIDSSYEWPSADPTYSLGVRVGVDVDLVGVDVDLGNATGSSISCSSQIGVKNLPIRIPQCPTCLSLDVILSVSGSASISKTNGDISIPIYLNGGVRARAIGASTFYQIPVTPDAFDTGIIEGSLSRSLSGSLNLHTPDKKILVLSGDITVAYTQSYTISLSKCTVSTATKSSYGITGTIAITTEIMKLGLVDLSGSIYLKAGVQRDIKETTLPSFNVSAKFCGTTPTPTPTPLPTPVTKPAVTLKTSNFPFSASFRVSGNGQAADLYFNLSGVPVVTIYGSVPRETSEGTLMIFYAEGASRTFVQSYAVGMGQHQHTFAPQRDGVYEFRVNFYSSATKGNPDSIFMSFR